MGVESSLATAAEIFVDVMWWHFKGNDTKALSRLQAAQNACVRDLVRRHSQNPSTYSNLYPRQPSHPNLITLSPMNILMQSLILTIIQASQILIQAAITALTT